MRVFWEASFPTELIEAARIDGASELRIFLRNRYAIDALRSGHCRFAEFRRSLE
jgi:hypothetical protein